MVHASVRAGAGGLALAPGSLALQLQNVGLVLQTGGKGWRLHVSQAPGLTPRGSSLMPPPPAWQPCLFMSCGVPWHPTPTLACLPRSRQWSSGGQEQ